MPESKHIASIIRMIAPILVAVTAIELLSRWVGDQKMSGLFAAIRILAITAIVSAALMRYRTQTSPTIESGNH